MLLFSYYIHANGAHIVGVVSANNALTARKSIHMYYDNRGRNIQLMIVKPINGITSVEDQCLNAVHELYCKCE